MRYDIRRGDHTRGGSSCGGGSSWNKDKMYQTGHYGSDNRNRLVFMLLQKRSHFISCRTGGKHFFNRLIRTYPPWIWADVVQNIIWIFRRNKPTSRQGFWRRQSPLLSAFIIKNFSFLGNRLHRSHLFYLRVFALDGIGIFHNANRIIFISFRFFRLPLRKAIFIARTSNIAFQRITENKRGYAKNSEIFSRKFQNFALKSE